MEPAIYKIPDITSTITDTNIMTVYGDKPALKLLKFGFDHITKCVDVLSITASDHHRIHLNIDFTRKDPKSIGSLCNEKLQMNSLDNTTAELWEIINVFRLMNTDQIYMSSHQDIVGTINKTMVSKKYVDGKSSPTKSPEKASLIINKYSDIDLDENVLIHMLLDDISSTYSKQPVGSSLVVQIFGCYTSVSADIIFCLASFYEKSHIYIPSVTPFYSDSKYLVLNGLKKKIQLKIPKQPTNAYVQKLLIDVDTDIIAPLLQCMNSHIVPKRLRKYFSIEKYIQDKIYEGAIYDDLMKIQNTNTEDWINKYTNIERLSVLVDNIIDKNSKACNFKGLLHNIFDDKH